MDNSKDLLLIENMVKLTALLKILEEKGVISESEISEKMNLISKELVESIKKVAQTEQK